MAATAAVYRPRNPQSSDYYRCVEDYFETFVQIYDDQFSRQYGFWRPYVQIENGEIIKAILKHLGLWLIKSRPPPKAHGPPRIEYIIDDHSQIPINENHLYRDPEYSWDEYLQA
jgi:hypothetical protein